MKTKLTLLLSLVCVFNYVAQDLPIQITTVIPPPYPQTFEEGLSLGDNSFILLHNTDMTQSYEVKLTAKITSDSGVSIEVLPEATPTQAITLAPGETRTVFGVELESLYLNYSQNDLVYSGIDLEEIANNPYFPEGTYVFCVKAWDYNTSAPLTNSILNGCAAPIYITTIDAPIITYPFDEQEVNALTPQLVAFSWTPVNYTSVNLRYAFQMVDYTDLEVNVYDLLDESDFLFYNEENIIGNTLIYGPSLPSLIPNHDYAVRVKAYLLGDELNIHNGGFSDVVRFHYTGDYNPYDPFGDGFFNPIGDNPLDDGLLDPIGDSPFDPIGGFGDDFYGWGDIDFSDLLDISTEDYTTTPGTGDNIVDEEAPPLVSNDLGCGGGCNPIPLDIDSPTNAPVEMENGDVVNIGHFQLEITSANGSANGGYTGLGFVESPLTDFFSYPVKVSFNGLKVNSQGQIMEGEANAVKRQGSWLDESWNNFEKNFDENSFGSNPQQMYDNINDPAFRLETWGTAQQSAPITLPAGYGGDDTAYKVQITEITFSPTQAFFDALVIIPLPDDEYGARHLVFTGDDFCLSQSGPSIGNTPATLSLSETVRFSPSDDVALKITSTGDAAFGEGTFVQLDCNGFFSANIEGQVLFSPEMLKAEDANGNLNATDTLAAAFSAEFQSWDAWVGDIHFGDAGNVSDGKVKSTRFQYTGLEGYTFKLVNAKFDHDVTSNLSGMTFPTDYSGSTGNDWQGLFISSVEFLLPKWAKDNSNDERMSIAGQQLIIDGSGFSGQFHGENLVTLEEGSLGGWDFSLDSAYFKIVSNTFHKGDMVGQLKMPISDEPLNYSANVDHSGVNLQHNFVISNEGDIAMPAFLSDITLAPNSIITVEINNNDVLVEADLSGAISLTDLSVEIPGCSFEDITFQNMMVRNQGEVFEIGSIGTDGVSMDMTLAGFDVGLNGMSMDEIEPLKYELGLDLNVQMGESNAEVSGGGRLFLLANRIDLSPEDFELDFFDADVSSIFVSGDLPGVNVNATVEHFDNETLGTGFAGDFDASFLESVNVSATAIFGSKMDGGVRKKFFLVEGMGSVPTGIPFAGPVALYGLGGGLYYNMKPTANYEVNEITNDSDEALSQTTISSRYTFEDGEVGLKAAVVVGLTPPDVFNADVALTVAINTNTFGISSVNFHGKGYMMTSITDRADPLMDITVDIGYNFTTDVLHGEMGMNVTVPSTDPMITANGDLIIHASPQTWFFKFGEPSQPVHGQIDFGLTAILDAYFMAGNNLPPAIIPDEVWEYCEDFEPTLMGTAAYSGIGVAMGVHANVHTSVYIFVADMDIQVLAGFDFTAMSYSNALCNGSADFGINQWYANVVGYVFGDIAFTTANFEWLSVYAGIIVEGALPNPSGFQGMAVFGIETWIEDFEVNHSFSVGTMCSMTTAVDQSGQELTVSSPVQGLEIIDFITPTNQTEHVGLTSEVEATFHIDPFENMYFNYSDGMGKLITEEIRFDRNVTWEEQIDGSFVDINFEETWNESEEKFTYRRMTPSGEHVEMLRPNTLHRFKVTVFPELWNDQTTEWDQIEDDNGTGILQETKQVYFTTEENITSINIADIDFCKPYDRQRYVTREDYEEAQIKFNISYQPSFDTYIAEGFEFHAKLYEIGASQPTHSIELNFEEEMKAQFDISQLAPETVFRIVFTATKTTSQSGEEQDIFVDNNISVNSDISDFNPNDYYQSGGPDEINTTSIEIIEMYTYFFRTSKYASLQEKIESYSITNSYAEVKPTGMSNPFLDNPFGHPFYDRTTYSQIHLILEGGEPFDSFDLFGHSFDPNGLTREIIYFKYLDADGFYDGDNSSLYCPHSHIDQFGNTVLVEGGIGTYTYNSSVTQGSSPYSFNVQTDGVSEPLSDFEVGLTSSSGFGGGYSGMFGGSNAVYIDQLSSKLHLKYETEYWAMDYYGRCSPLDMHDMPFFKMTSGNFYYRLITRDADDSYITPTRQTDLNPVYIEIQ